MADVYDELEAEINEATVRARKLIETTDGRLFTVRPNPASWSPAECLAHLTLSTKSFLPVLDQAITQGRGRGMRTTKPPKMDLLGRILRWFLEPPIRQKVKTSAPFVPQSTRAKAEALAEFSSLQSQLIEKVREARGLDLSKLKIISPFDQRLRYNVYSAFLILTAHERRHLWQAEQAAVALRAI